MGNAYAVGRRALAICDRCGFTVKLKVLREIVVKNSPTNLMVCRSCWEESHPQLMLGSFPIVDAQALYRARPDNAAVASRDTQWGWNPVGGGNAATGAYNALVAEGEVGDVTVVVT